MPGDTSVRLARTPPDCHSRTERPSRAVRPTPRDSLGERGRAVDDQQPLHIGSAGERLEEMRIASPEAFDLQLPPVVEREGEDPARMTTRRSRYDALHP